MIGRIGLNTRCIGGGFDYNIPFPDHFKLFPGLAFDAVAAGFQKGYFLFQPAVQFQLGIALQFDLADFPFLFSQFQVAVVSKNKKINQTKKRNDKEYKGRIPVNSRWLIRQCCGKRLIHLIGFRPLPFVKSMPAFSFNKKESDLIQ